MGMPTPHLDAKLLYRRLDSLFGALKPNRPARRVLESFVEDAFRTLQDDLALKAALLYSEKQDEFVLAKALGEIGGPAVEALSPEALPVSLALQHGVYLFPEPERDDSPGRHGLLPHGPAAALAVGRRPNRHVILFLLREDFVREELDFALNTVRAALGARLREERVFGKVKEAAEIQQSLLLEEPPAFAGFDLACRSLAAEEVGGDFYDFLSFGPDMLGVAIGDASGHGLPAALVVRDVVTGLRMGVAQDLKVTYVFNKLNRVIHRSNLSSRFVSVFYGELEAEGNFIYVNAGHPPPLVFRPGGGVQALDVGGTVIGPLPEVSFRRGFARLEPGDVLVGCTDGILERRDPAGEFFGDERFAAQVRAHFDASAAEILEAMYDAAFAFGGGRAWEDDATMVVVKRLA